MQFKVVITVVIVSSTSSRQCKVQMDGRTDGHHIGLHLIALLDQSAQRDSNKF
jgi:hypothetical protein